MLDPAQIKGDVGGSDPDGGYLVPADLGGRIATKLYELSNIRQIAFVQPTSGDKIQGIEDLNEGGRRLCWRDHDQRRHHDAAGRQLVDPGA